MEPPVSANVKGKGEDKVKVHVAAIEESYEELMESRIKENMATPTVFAPYRKKNVRFCEGFTTEVPCAHFGEDVFCNEHQAGSTRPRSKLKEMRRSSLRRPQWN